MSFVPYDPFKFIYDFFNRLGQQIYNFLVPSGVQIISGFPPNEPQKMALTPDLQNLLNKFIQTFVGIIPLTITLPLITTTLTEVTTIIAPPSKEE